MKRSPNATLMAARCDLRLTLVLVTFIVMRWGERVRWVTTP